MTTPYRNEIDALRERQASLAGEISKLREQTTGLDELRAREGELARELAGVEQRIAAGGAAKRALPLLDRVRVASPCKADWNEMLGDERVRFCLGCEKNVYNLSSMAREDAEALLQARLGNDLCIRFYQRADGTILTEDCPVGVKKKQRKKLVLAVAGAGAMAAAAASMFLKPTCRGESKEPVAVAGGAMYVDPVPTVMGTAAPPVAPVPEPPAVPTNVHPEPKHTMGKPAVMGRR
ncbi:MAG TPA: hypothetical protein VLT33_36005 [Labilithrix sp.]|nr:hypothetical protein [Labilithrix sp.]